MGTLVPLRSQEVKIAYGSMAVASPFLSVLKRLEIEVERTTGYIEQFATALQAERERNNTLLTGYIRDRIEWTQKHEEQVGEIELFKSALTEQRELAESAAMNKQEEASKLREELQLECGREKARYTAERAKDFSELQLRASGEQAKAREEIETLRRKLEDAKSKRSAEKSARNECDSQLAEMKKLSERDERTLIEFLKDKKAWVNEKSELKRQLQRSETDREEAERREIQREQEVKSLQATNARLRARQAELDQERKSVARVVEAVAATRRTLAVLQEVGDDATEAQQKAAEDAQQALADAIAASAAPKRTGGSSTRPKQLCLLCATQATYRARLATLATVFSNIT